MRDYRQFDEYLDRITGDVYAQPPDPGHTEWALDAVREYCAIPKGVGNVLDVGCGQGFLSQEFKNMGIHWTGVTIGEDYKICKKNKLNVKNADMTFLPFNDKEFGMVFARHVLEHSPFPILTLMEWRRVCRGHLVLVAPSPNYWGWSGKNHYSVMSLDQTAWLLKRAGWNPIHMKTFTSRDPKFLKHWKVYQQALFEQGEEAGERVLKENPEVVVEHRLLLERVEPTLE